MYTTNITNEELTRMIQEEARQIGLPIYVKESIPLELYFQTLGMREVLGIIIPTETEDKPYIFLDSLQKVIKTSTEIVNKFGPAKKYFDFYKDPKGSMKKYIKGIIKGEYRHWQQFQYMRSHGIDAKIFCQEEAKKPWYKKWTRLDVWMYETFGFGLPLSFVCR